MVAKSQKAKMKAIAVKAKAKVKAKKPEPKSAEAVSDETRMALLFKHKRKLKPLLAVEAEAKKAVTQAYEIAKKDGIPKDEIKYAIELETEEGEEKAQVEFERKMRVARWMGIPLGTQLDMFPKQTNAERHYADGHRAALDDKPASPPTHLAQKDAQHWLSGHAQGRVIRNEQLMTGPTGFKPLSDAADKLVSKVPPATDAYPPPPPDETRDTAH